MDAKQTLTRLVSLIADAEGVSGDDERKQAFYELLEYLQEHSLLVVTCSGECLPILRVDVHRYSDHECPGYVVGGSGREVHLNEVDWEATQRAWDIALSPPPFEAAQFVGLLPRNWERAFGYRGSARWLAVWWTPAGDEALFDDGEGQAAAQWTVYLDLVQNRIAIPLARALANYPRGRYALGSSDEEATHCLLLDLEHRGVYVAPIGEALRFLQAQAQPAQEALQVDLETLLQALREVARRSPDLSPRVLCPRCGGVGWIRALDGGYDECDMCHGEGWLSEEE